MTSRTARTTRTAGSTGSTGSARATVTRRDWIEAAYRELARAGERGVGITSLARRLGVTKGSFYWHFKDRAELMGALLDRWAHERTDEMLALALGSTTDPIERLRRIKELGREIAPIDRAMRLWAQHDPEAADAVRHADRALLGHLATSLGELGFPAADARQRAMLMLRAWVGGYLVPAPDPADETADGWEAAFALLIRPPAAGPDPADQITGTRSSGSSCR